MFAEAHYKVTINISKTNESVLHGGEVGMFVVHAISANGKKTERMQLSLTSKYYEPGSTHTVVLPGNVVGKPQSVEITWEYKTSVFNPLTWRLFLVPRVYIDSLTIENLETAHRYFLTRMRDLVVASLYTVDHLGLLYSFCRRVTLCPDETRTLIANEAKILTVDNCNVTKNNVIST